MRDARCKIEEIAKSLGEDNVIHVLVEFSASLICILQQYKNGDVPREKVCEEIGGLLSLCAVAGVTFGYDEVVHETNAVLDRLARAAANA